MIDSDRLKRKLLSDIRVELTEEFDKNFERKAFFTDKWKRRANPTAKHRAAIKEFGVTPYHRLSYNLLGEEPRQLEFDFGE